MTAYASANVFDRSENAAEIVATASAGATSHPGGVGTSAGTMDGTGATADDGGAGVVTTGSRCHSDARRRPPPHGCRIIARIEREDC
ncbi:hypothetical protein [Nocardia fluminea]|uniref:hypothetical protein n=1 Tax=Nocardia fluminea TaxID=134984 RepID=UPI00364BC9D9